MRKIISLTSLPISLNFYQFNASDFGQKWVKQEMEIYTAWQKRAENLNVKFDFVYTGPEQRAFYTVLENSPIEYVVGDVHGDLNQLLLNLIGSGIARFAPGQPPFIFINPKTGQKSHNVEEICSSGNYWEELRMIPHLQFVGDAKAHVTFLGDILDRGASADACFYSLVDLCRQQAESKTDRRLHWVFGDHEIYGLMPHCPLMALSPPNYKSNIAKRDNDLALMAWAIADAIEKRYLTYAHVGRNGVLYSHSFITEAFITKFCNELISEEPVHRAVSRAERPQEEIEKVIDAAERIKSGGDQNSITILVDHFNLSLVAAARLFKIPRNAHLILNLCLFEIENNGTSPIFTRANPLPLMHAVGHTAQLNNTVKQEGKEIYNFDTAACYAIEQRGYSEPRLCRINPDGTIEVGEIGNSETEFKITI